MKKRELIIIFILALATIVVHLINLGMLPLFGDEPIRASVAFEMMKSNNYVVPTIFGEFYYKKPPFYNWIIIGFFKLFHSYSEFVFRLPSVLPLMIFGFVIWWVSRKNIGSKAGVIAAFAFVLSGRILTRDSMLGHIDILYSLFTFMGFYAVYFYHKQKKYWQLFLFSYLLAAIGVLMKGLPSFLFQAFTVGVWFLYKRDVKKLFSVQHAAGILLFAAIVGGYFYAYTHYNTLENYFGALYSQAAMRTVVERKWYEGILNIFTFPFENFGHLFPTSLLLLFAFKKGIIKRWLKDDFSAFTLIVLAVNLIPYWLSPGYFPRYLFMLYPLVFILAADAYMKNKDEMPKVDRFMQVFFLVVGIIVSVAMLVPMFLPEMKIVDGLYWKAILAFLIGAFVIYLWFKQTEYRIYWIFAFIILFRLGFDWFVIPHRTFLENSLHTYKREQGLKLAEVADGRPIGVFKSVPIDINYAYYVGAQQEGIVYRNSGKNADTLWIVDQTRLKHFENYEVLYKFPSRYRDYEMHLIELKKD